jgi:hypothetical protein
MYVIFALSGLKNSPTVTHACRKRRLKWVPSVWGYSWTTLSPGVINTETWSFRLGVGRWTNNPALQKDYCYETPTVEARARFGLYSHVMMMTINICDLNFFHRFNDAAPLSLYSVQVTLLNNQHQKNANLIKMF